MENSKTIIGICIKERLKDASKLQAIFTKYGCNIKTRLGLHDAHENVCSGTGVVLLELIGIQDELLAFENSLKEIDGIEFQKMFFKY